MRSVKTKAVGRASLLEAAQRRKRALPSGAPPAKKSRKEVPPTPTDESGPTDQGDVVGTDRQLTLYQPSGGKIAATPEVSSEPARDGRVGRDRSPTRPSTRSAPDDSRRDAPRPRPSGTLSIPGVTPAPSAIGRTLPQAMDRGKAAEPPSGSGEKSGSAFTTDGARNLIETVLLEKDRRRVRELGVSDVGAASCVCLMSVSVLLAAFHHLLALLFSA